MNGDRHIVGGAIPGLGGAMFGMDVDIAIGDGASHGVGGARP